MARKNLITVTRVAERTVRVDVTTEAVNEARKRGLRIMTRLERESFVTNLLFAMGISVNDPIAENLGTPFFITPKRGVANDGFRALVSVK